MKHLIALFCVASSVAVFAEGNASGDYTQSGNTFGALRVNIGSGIKEAIIAVPWLEPSTGVDAIAVTNVIKTANLSQGDQLNYYDTATKKYQAWTLDANKIWEAAKDASAPNPSQTLSRGNAILLKASATLPEAIYLHGQAPAAGSVSTPMAKGTSSSAAYTLFAPPNVGVTDLNLGATWTNVTSSDYIVLPDMTQLVYESNHGGWCEKKRVVDKVTKKKTTSYDTTKAKISAGQGAWFVSGVSSSGEAASVQWK